MGDYLNLGKTLRDMKKRLSMPDEIFGMQYDETCKDVDILITKYKQCNITQNQLNEQRNRYHPKIMSLTEERDRYKARAESSENKVKELEIKNKELCLIDWKGLFETRVILLQKTEIILKETIDKLLKALEILKEIESRKGINRDRARLFYYTQYYDRLKKALEGDTPTNGDTKNVKLYTKRS